MTQTPVDDYLDELLRRTRADARTTRRLLDEAGDHLHTTAAELQATGMSRHDAELEAVRRFWPARPIVRATFRRSFVALILETLRAALFLAGCGLVAVGISGLVALVMILCAGRNFVGGVSVPPFQAGSVAETADDAVVLRVIAGGNDATVRRLDQAAAARLRTSGTDVEEAVVPGATHLFEESGALDAVIEATLDRLRDWTSSS